MGITDFSVGLLNRYIAEYNPKSVCEMGDQNLYTNDHNYGKYANLYYEQIGIEKYVCVDLNGGNGAIVIDMGKPIVAVIDQFCLVTDFGFQEHVGADGHFDWEAVYNCWANKWALLKEGGIMINENPLEGNWPKHGYNYLNEGFYIGLSKMCDLLLLEMGKHAAMGNVTDGWNIFAVLKKTGDKFPSIDEFKTLPIKQS